LTKRSLI